MDDAEKYDSLLLGVLQHVGRVEPFIEIIFSFLCRRTDFFLPLDKEANRGFPDCYIRNMLLSKYELFRSQAIEMHGLKSRDSEPTKDKQQASKKIGVSEKPPNATAGHADKGLPVALSATDHAATLVASDAVCAPSTIQEPSSAAETDKKPSAERAYQADPWQYNGADLGAYCWAQSISDLDVRVRVPSQVKRASNVNVVISRRKLSVKYSGVDTDWTVVLENSPLALDVKTEDSFWSLMPSDHIHINLEKCQERWWDHLIGGESKINIRQIDASRPITDLSQEAQAKIEQCMYDDQQKKLGLPTSKEQEMEKMLREAWDKDGSPFKGTPFDPSSIQMS